MGDSRIDLLMHVGGAMKFGRVIRYVGGKSEKFGAVDCDKIGYFTLVHLAGALGFAANRLWYVLPRHSLSTGLREIHSDKDVGQMVSVALVIGYVNVYVEGGRNDSEDRFGNSADVIGTDGRAQKVRGRDVGSEEDSGKVHYCIISPSLSEETGHTEMGSAASVGTKGRVRMEEEHNVVYKDTGNLNEAALKRIRQNHTSFDPQCGPEDLVFAVGLAFDDEDQFAEAVRRQAAHKRADVHFGRSTSMTVEAECVPGCPWRVHASWELSEGKFVVKRSELEHNCVTARGNDRGLQASNSSTMGLESKGERNTKERQLAPRPSDFKEQTFSVEPIQDPSGQDRLRGLRKKSEVRRGGITSNQWGRRNRKAMDPGYSPHMNMRLH
ncbi:hypothetical protein MLD38_040325 [Melastoma candidum]|uniref:Uncharacterized protein n=1 Tax=Melastoma candidum TaxID=119954 RepID=A0ACB9L5L4_9MYRT|nr:hypothetical protein MLD38_040325 [Melastoma candidum]